MRGEETHADTPRHRGSVRDRSHQASLKARTRAERRCPNVAAPSKQDAANLFGSYRAFGSLEPLIETSIVKAAVGAILSVGLMRLGMRLVRPKWAGR